MAEGRVLLIAGSDSGGGAGVQADIKTVTALGGYAATAITAITVQDTLGVHEIWPVPPRVVAAQAQAVLADIGADAVKIGMLAESGEAGKVVLQDAAIEPEQVADALLAGMAAGRFLILPHPEVGGYYAMRAGDPDRWLRGMNRMQQRIEEVERGLGGTAEGGSA